MQANYLTRHNWRFHALLLGFFLLFSFQSAFAQAISSRDYTPKSPEATSMNRYGEYAVGHFTGRPNIGIPLSVSEEVPIDLSYNAGGNKPEEHHGWVGLGWNLNVGGMITRVKRGFQDEFKDPYLNPSNGNTNGPTGYLENNWRLKGTPDTWGVAALNTKIALTSSIALGDSAQWRTQKADLEPDEFVFNFGGYSGSFMLNHEGKWIFRGNNPNEFKLTATLATGFNVEFVPQMSCVISIPRIFTGFIITTSDGTDYTFGGNSNAMDINYDFSDSDANNPKTMFASAWHLTKITYVSGKQIKFFYDEKKDFSLIINRIRTLSSSTGWMSHNNTLLDEQSAGDTKSGSIVFNSYLSKIETPYEVIRFNREALSGYLDYGDLDQSVQYNGSTVAQYSAINSTFCIDVHSSSTKRKWYKLNDIKCFSKVNDVETTTLLRQFNFIYAPPVANPTTTNPKRSSGLMLCSK